MTAPMTPRKRIQMHFDVATDDQAAELRAAWEEIVSGKLTRINTAAEDTNDIMERARTGLQKIVKAIEENPGTGQVGRLVKFLAGVYNGHEFLFDLTDLRALDTELANACIDYLNYDRNGSMEKMWRAKSKLPCIIGNSQPRTPHFIDLGAQCL
jgi:hypothetical protein